MNNISIYWFVLCALLLSAASCNEDLNEENNKLKAENERLKIELQEIKNESEQVLNAVHHLQSNMLQIALRRKKIDELVKNKAPKEKVLKEIQLINTLQQLNNDKLKELKDVKSNKSIEIVNRISENKNFEDEAIELIRTKLSSLNYEVDLLTKTLDSVTFMNEINLGVLELELNDMKMAYYCSGDFKMLSENKIIKKKGGVAGIGSVPVVYKDFNKSKFKQINLETTNKIRVKASKVELLSTHPSNSYQIIDKEDEKIILISNPKAFWEATRYLIILEKK